MSLKRLHVILILAAFPLAAFLVKDYVVVYRSARPVVASVEPASVPAMRLPSIQDYAGIVEDAVLPTSSRKFVAVSGTAMSMSRVKASVAGSATPSGISLVGTLFSPSDVPGNFAVFEKKGGQGGKRGRGGQEVFRVGDNVFDVGILKTIRSDGAVLSAGSRELVFVIAENSKALNLSGARRAGKARAGRGPNAEPSRGPAASGVFIHSKKTGENEWSLSREAVLNSLNDMGQVLTAARLTPSLKDGTVEGFLVTEIKPRGILDAIGLKNGDVLKRVNGYEITSPERAVQVLSALKGETSFNVDIVRRGENRSFNYELR